MKPQIYFCKNSIKLIAVFMLCFANAQKSSYFSNGTNFPIPDEGSFVYSTIVVTGIPEDAHIVHLDMQVRADHTYVGDLAMGLDMPNYQTLGLAHRPGTDAVSGSPFGNSANLSSENYIYFMDDINLMS